MKKLAQILALQIDMAIKVTIKNWLSLLSMHKLINTFVGPFQHKFRRENIFRLTFLRLTPRHAYAFINSLILLWLKASSYELAESIPLDCSLRGGGLPYAACICRATQRQGPAYMLRCTPIS